MGTRAELLNEERERGATAQSRGPMVAGRSVRAAVVARVAQSNAPSTSFNVANQQGTSPSALLGCSTSFRVPEANIAILDEHALFAESLGYSFQQLGFSVFCESNLQSAFESVLGPQTRIVVTELKVCGISVLDCLDEIRSAATRARIVIATAQPSIATATRAIRLGVDAYLAKPVSAPLVLQTLQDTDQPQNDPSTWPSLDRTIWEYLNQVFAASGSMSEAARRLGLDRRSLRRMLAKDPPVR